MRKWLVNAVLSSISLIFNLQALFDRLERDLRRETLTEEMLTREMNQMSVFVYTLHCISLMALSLSPMCSQERRTVRVEPRSKLLSHAC